MQNKTGILEGWVVVEGGGEWGGLHTLSLIFLSSLL